MGGFGFARDFRGILKGLPDMLPQIGIINQNIDQKIGKSMGVCCSLESRYIGFWGKHSFWVDKTSKTEKKIAIKA